MQCDGIADLIAPSLTVLINISALSLFGDTKHANKTKEYSITPNNNISFPIGTILAVEKLYNTLHFSPVFGKLKKKGLDINSLLKALISYKLIDNFSIDRAHEWINREEVLELFDLKQFNERALYRTLQTLGNNREEIISDIQDILFRVYDFPHTDVNMDWRVWSDASIYGAIVVGFIAQLFISLMRYEFDELKHKSTKFIKKSLLNLTVTVDYVKSGAKKFIYANFDPMNTLILRGKQGIT